MYVKLLMRNVKRCARDYLVYCVTVGVTVALVYAFDLLLLSPELWELLDEGMEDFASLITAVTFVVVLVSAGLIRYVTSFLLRRRSRELATYLLLGMENRTMRRLFLGENALMGGISFLGGVAAGSLLFQLLRAVLLNLLKKDYAFRLYFSWQSFFLTLFYFGAVYLVTLWRIRRKLKKSNIHDLMYGGSRNQTGRLRHPVLRWLVLAVSGGMLFVSLFLLPKLFDPSEADVDLLVMILLGLMGIFGLYAGIAALLAAMSKASRARLRGVNLVLFRQLSGKINSHGMLMGTVAVLLTISLLLFAGGFGLQLSFEPVKRKDIPFDLVVSSDDPNIRYDSALALARQASPDLQTLDYAIYSIGGRPIQSVLAASGFQFSFYHTRNDLCISCSDYNQLRALLGYPPVELGVRQYLVHSEVLAYADTLRKQLPQEPPLQIEGEALAYGGVEDQLMMQDGVNGFEYLLVLPDRLCGALPVQMRNLVATSPNGLPETLYQPLKDAVLQDNTRIYEEYSMWISMSSYRDTYSRFTLAATVFSLLYLGVVMTLICATVLAIQQLSDASELKRRFALLRRMGAEERELNRLLRRLLGLFFGLPALLPVLVTAYALWRILPAEYTRLIGYQLWLSFWLTMGLFFLLYLCYFTVAYIGCKRILRER